MAVPSRNPSISHLLCRNRTQLIFTSSLLISATIILLLLTFSITSNTITESSNSPTLPTATTHLLYASSHITSLSSKSTFDQGPNVSSMVIVPPLSLVENGSIFVSAKKVTNGDVFDGKMSDSCDIFDGKWVLDYFEPVYSPGSCPFVDQSFDCFNNGRGDLEYLRYRWQPHGCNIPRFDGKKMLKLLRGKRMVFVGDSLNRNMWQSLICSLRNSLVNKRSMIEVSGARQFRAEGYYSFKFLDYNCTIEFVRSPYLVQEWNLPIVEGRTRRQMLRLDLLQASSSKYHNADILIFNTGHWWTHRKTRKGKNFFQEGDFVHSVLKVKEAYTKALRTWANWVDKNVNKTKTQVFFAGYSASHFRGKQWNSAGNCDGETKPIINDKHLAPYPWMMKILESVISEMSTPVVYLNITKMTGYRKDAHPSIYRMSGTKRRPKMIQDCSHWCLPGVPESWNQLFYASLLRSPKKSDSTY